MNDELVSAIDEHLKKLRTADTQPLAIVWMKQAHELLRMCANELEKPKIFSIPWHFGERTFMLTPPAGLKLPEPGFKPKSPIWLEGKTVVYAPPKAWTRKDTDKLVKQNAKKS